jgi:hypothetical protein
MKPAIGSVAAAVVVALTVACSPNVFVSGRDATPSPSSHSLIAAERLRKMPGLTGFDALRMLPDYLGRANRRPAPRFMLIIDGAHTSEVELLKTILATDLFEIRIVTESQTVISGGDVEIIVTTLGGRRGP